MASINESVDLLDKITIKLIIVFSSILTGLFLGALFVNNFNQLFISDLTEGLPKLAIYFLPFAMYCLLHTSLDALEPYLRRSAIRKAQTSTQKAFNAIKKITPTPSSSEGRSINDLIKIAQDCLKAVETDISHKIISWHNSQAYNY